ncbi:hypothetical protein NDK50_23020 [Paraburkholderia bryophila]|uniref:hypothetical protein n=1 Tax=Paraburkholderia bryophila TaxID=420952 RepID=UPI00234B0C50|nr:hypothetical protein [Paraburkholderia bryophila]WCM23727.1 hypothetical protein NDK50_23020 [Paraburkholderia bryophila]
MFQPTPIPSQLTAWRRYERGGATVIKARPKIGRDAQPRATCTNAIIADTGVLSRASGITYRCFRQRNYKRFTSATWREFETISDNAENPLREASYD